MKKSSFTLVELLVVIGIIGILAGMIMPALGGARASGVRTECINNRHQLGLGALQYANDNKQVIPLCLKGFADTTSKVWYGYILAGKLKSSNSSVSVNSYLPDKVLICNEATVTTLDSTATNAVGMLDLSETGKDNSWYTNEDVLKSQGRYRSIKGKNVVYSLTRMKDPASLILFADTFKKIGSVKNGKPNTYCLFLPGNMENGTGWVTTIHQNSTVVGMADGSSRAMTAGELYGSSLLLETTLKSDMEHTVSAK